MSKLARRELLGAVFAGMGAFSLPAFARASVPLPQGTMVLSRRIERPLMDGQKIVVTRKWLVSFANHPQGISITGRQIDVTVDAPIQLAALADIERSRSTDGMFPILLSPAGLIAAAGQQEADVDVARAARTAEAMIAKSGASEGQKLATAHVLSQLQMASGSLFDNLPPDLFFPSGKPSHNIRPVNLPDGSTGQFELNYDAQPCSSGGWLQQASRKIVTRLGNTTRYSLEMWSLEAA